jgi:D-arabinose 5-phosphate isomerase GutQ
MSNVVSLMNRSQAKTVAVSGQNNSSLAAASQTVLSEATARDTQAGGLTFSEIAERNKINQERLRKEREQANKSVLKSYRIK